MITTPLVISNGRLQLSTSPKDSIDISLARLIATPKGSWAIDRDYGFVFNNLRFEIFNENEGVVYDSNYGESAIDARLKIYEKKVSGSSKNLNTFAAELKDSITKYEKRIRDINVAMTYVREARLIYVSVKGYMVATSEPYQYKTTIKVWN